MPTATSSVRRVALYVDDFWGGGLQKVMITLARGIAARGHAVEVLACDPAGPLRGTLPASVKVVPLERVPKLIARLYPFAADPGATLKLLRPVLLARSPSPTLPYLPALARYLRRARPDGLITASPRCNLEGIWARRLADVGTRLLLSHHTTLSDDAPDSRRWQRRYLPTLIRHAYAEAEAIVVVCDALGDDLAAVVGLQRERMQTIYNPVVSPEIEEGARQPLDHPWFLAGAPPVLLAAGRICRQKDFSTLIRAFARVRAAREARLMILGEAKNPAKNAKRVADLRALSEQLGIAKDVEMPGYVANPFAYMARAAVFVLSSRYEGLGNVLIEAMACGCPVVSTDCPVGPAEILESGHYGPLVAVGDDAALADAILRTLDAPLPAEVLRARAADFSVESAVDRYLDVLFERNVDAPARASA